jgi:hypothetical protein
MTFEPLTGNRAIEDAAIRYVMDLERHAGREPIDRRYEATFAADVSSPPRTIEVKAVGKDQRGWFIPVEPRQYDAARSDPEFYFYVVYNIGQGDPAAFRIKVFHGEQLRRLLDKAKKREYWEMPIPVGEFDDAPGAEAVLGKDTASAPDAGPDLGRRLNQLNEAMLDIYHNAKRDAGYNATIYLQLLANRGPLDTARFLIHRDQPSDGYTALFERGRLDLTVEALVIQPQWGDVFDERDRAASRARLEAYGFDVYGYLARLPKGIK